MRTTLKLVVLVVVHNLVRYLFGGPIEAVVFHFIHPALRGPMWARSLKSYLIMGLLRAGGG